MHKTLRFLLSCLSFVAVASLAPTDASANSSADSSAKPAPLRFAKRATCESAFSDKLRASSNESPKLLSDLREPQKLLTYTAQKPKPTSVDRKPYFEAAYDRLGRVLKFAEENVRNLTADEQKMLKELTEFMAVNMSVYDNGATHFQSYLWFLESQGNFMLDYDQPIRTAATRGGVRDPIAINLPLISKPENNMNLLEVVQLMLHEIGHKAPNKIQNAVDSLAAKIAVALQSHYRTIDLGNDTSMEILSVPNKHSNVFTDSLSRPGLVVLLKSPTGVIDISEQVIEALRPLTRPSERNQLSRIGTFEEEPFQILNQFVWTNEKVLPDPSSSQSSNLSPSLMLVRATIARSANAVSSSAKPVYPQGSLAQPPNDAQDLEILIRTGDEPAVVSTGRRIHYPQVELNNEILLESDWKDESHLEIQASGVEGLKVRALLLKSDLAEFEAPVRAVTEDAKLKFEVRVPARTNQKSIRASSLILEDGRRVSAANSVRIEFTDNFDPKAGRDTQYLKAKMKTPFGWQALGRADSPRLHPGKNSVELFVKSEKPLREVRVRVETEIWQFDSTAFKKPQFFSGDLTGGPVTYNLAPDFTFPRYKTNVVTWIVLREGEFKQTRRGDLVRIEADLDLQLQHRVQEETSSYRQPISHFYTATGRITYRNHVGWDFGSRLISALEITDESLHTTRVEAEQPLEFRLTKEAGETEAALSEKRMRRARQILDARG